MFIDVFGIETKNRSIYGVSTSLDKGNKVLILEYLLAKVDSASESMDGLLREYQKYNSGASYVTFSTTTLQGGQIDTSVTIVDMVAVYNAAKVL